jgi:hypothetical protein
VFIENNVTGDVVVYDYDYGYKAIIYYGSSKSYTLPAGTYYVDVVDDEDDWFYTLVTITAGQTKTLTYDCCSLK